MRDSLQLWLVLSFLLLGLNPQIWSLTPFTLEGSRDLRQMMRSRACYRSAIKVVSGRKDLRATRTGANWLPPCTHPGQRSTGRTFSTRGPVCSPTLETTGGRGASFTRLGVVGIFLLRDVFALGAWNLLNDRRGVPPFLLFQRAMPGRSVAFNGLLAPGAASLSSDDDLVAVWRSTGGQRFQNYRARFTVLDAGHIPRLWIDDVLAGKAYESEHCPAAWRSWVDGRVYVPLEAPATTIVRAKSQQLPSDPVERAILAEVRGHFQGREHEFEPIAVELWRLVAPATGRCDVTRPSRDGGRDAVGQYVVGPKSDPIALDFALEAKCYSAETSVGVRDVARLISRIRHREFGVFITTSHFATQAYAEVRVDGHPIVMICGQDIVDALKAHGYTDVARVRAWLNRLSTDAPG